MPQISDSDPPAQVLESLFIHAWELFDDLKHDEVGTSLFAVLLHTAQWRSIEILVPANGRLLPRPSVFATNCLLNLAWVTSTGPVST
jgi:hypothetical protein